MSDPVWNGLFETWQQACEAASSGGNAFVSDRWLNRIIQQLQVYRDSCSRYETALPPRPSTLPWVCALMRPRSIIDFGGSSGWCYDYLQHTLQDHSISSYVIVEIERVVEEMNNAGLHSAPVMYRTATDRLEHCDLLYSNSVLQYFESNTQLLDLVVAVSPEYILLDDLMARGEKDFFSTQLYYGTAIPYRFLSLRQLTSDMGSIGYKQVLSAPFASPISNIVEPLPMGNFPAEFQLRYPLSLLLKRLPKR